MNQSVPARINKVPFFAADAVLLALAAFIILQTSRPMNGWEAFGAVAAVALAGWFGFLPYLKEYQAALRFAEADRLASTVEKVNDLDRIARQISSATDSWDRVQDLSAKTAEAARDVARQMDEEAKAFTEFLQKANDAEKNHLRLETEKLRRAQGDWIQVVVHVLDHVHALHQAALQSGQEKVIQQISQLQHACRDAARRVGLVPFAAENAEAFDAARHQTVEGDAEMPKNTLVSETIAPGINFQGQLLRRALVRTQEPASDVASAQVPVEEASMAAAPEATPPEQSAGEPEVQRDLI